MLVDTLRQDHLRAYGYARETAPTLTRLAATGAMLDGLSPTSWTKPAVASLFTGLHPLRHQTVALNDSLPQQARTLAEILRARGYDTLGVTANGFSSARFGMDQGFRELAYLADIGHSTFATADEVDQELFARLVGLRRPYFLFVHYLDPHAPYDPPGWGDVRPGAQHARPVAIQDLEMETFLERPDAFVRRAIDVYDGEIVRADAALGRLLDRLRDAGLMDSTLTVVASDHGEEFQEHGRMGHGQTLYEEVVRVPLVFHWPGRIPEGTRHGTASLLDVLPTTLDLLGVPHAAGELDGTSLADALASGRRYEPQAREFLLHLDVARSHYLALQKGADKLVLGRYPHRKELFDLAHDPREHTNLLIDGRSAAFAPLAGLLSVRPTALSARALPRICGNMSAMARASLAALGYVGNAADGECERRMIPERPHVADATPDGPLGWEEPRTFRSCLDLQAPAAADQLLSGWHEAEPRGRWAWPQAELLLAPPATERRLRVRVSGVRREQAAGRLRVLVDGQACIDADVPAGEFELWGPLVTGSPAPEGAPRRVRLERTPVYVPAALGPPPRGRDADHRRLGFLFSAVCLEPFEARRASPPGRPADTPQSSSRPRHKAAVTAPERGRYNGDQHE